MGFANIAAFPAAPLVPPPPAATRSRLGRPTTARHLRRTPSRCAYDHLGSTSLITNGRGVRLDRLEYGPWGEQVSGNHRRTRFTYTGHQMDRRSGNYYSVHRYLDPRVGRWTQRDSLGDADGQNRYVYALNAPTSGIDLLGLKVTGLSSTLVDSIRLWPTGKKVFDAVDRACDVSVDISELPALDIEPDPTDPEPDPAKKRNRLKGIFFGLTDEYKKVGAGADAKYSARVRISRGSQEYFVGVREVGRAITAAEQQSIISSSGDRKPEYEMRRRFKSPAEIDISVEGTIVHELVHVLNFVEAGGVPQRTEKPSVEKQLLYWGERGFK